MDTLLKEREAPEASCFWTWLLEGRETQERWFPISSLRNAVFSFSSEKTPFFFHVKLLPSREGRELFPGDSKDSHKIII